MATNLNKLFVFVPSASTASFKENNLNSEDYLNKIAFLEGTGEIATHGKIFAVNSDSDFAALKTIIGQNEGSWKSFASGVTSTDIIGYLNELKALVDANTTAISNASAGLTKRVADLETSVDTASTGLKDRMTSIEGQVSTLVGNDASKSARTIAAEEVAKVVANADSAFDTLKEIADWISNDQTGAAKMGNDISALQTKVGEAAVAPTTYTAEEAAAYNTEHNLQEGDPDYKSEGDIKTAGTNGTGLYATIDNLQEQITSMTGGAGSISEQINTKINTLDGNVTLAGTTASQPSTIAKNTYIDVLGSVTVAEVDGVLNQSSSDKVVLQADAAGAAQKAYDELLGDSTVANDGSSLTIYGVKKYAEKIVGDKNVSASGDNNLIDASATNNAVSVSATQNLIDAVSHANTAIQSVTLSSGNTTYVTVTSVSGSGDATAASASINPVLGTLTNNATGNSVLSYADGLASTRVVADAINSIELWENFTGSNNG